MTTTTTTARPCWILHQRGDDGGIVANGKRQNLMFRSVEDALYVLACRGFAERGFVAQQMPDAEEFRQACLADGYEAVWFEEAIAEEEGATTQP